LRSSRFDEVETNGNSIPWANRASTFRTLCIHDLGFNGVDARVGAITMSCDVNEQGNSDDIGRQMNTTSQSNESVQWECLQADGTQSVGHDVNVVEEVRDLC
jgi:hypothetical protein